MSDLIKRLQEHRTNDFIERPLPICLEAADELERLRTRLEIDPRHSIDGIQARDTTIRLQDEAIAELRNELERMQKDADRYRWLRDRMKVHCEAPMSGGEKRATLTMRIGHGFLDSKMDPTSGWTDLRWFDECREKVDSAIDAAMKGESE